MTYDARECEYGADVWPENTKICKAGECEVCIDGEWESDTDEIVVA